VSEPKRYIPYIAFENMAYPFPAMREVDANWKQYADVKMAYVTDADYARLKAEVERLKAEPDALTAYLYADTLRRDDIKTLKAHIRRLTKAGDAMAEIFKNQMDNEPDSVGYLQEQLVNRWNAAKEGNQP
jgi:hypothetical protein